MWGRRTVGALLEGGEGDASDDGQQHEGLGHRGWLAVEERVHDGREHGLAAAARRGGGSGLSVVGWVAAVGWAATAAERGGVALSRLNMPSRHCEGVLWWSRLARPSPNPNPNPDPDHNPNSNPNPNPNPNQVEAHPALTI